MSSTKTRKVAAAANVDVATLVRVAREGYGEGAWHGNDLRAALADVSPELAFWRPGPGRHNIAEIALHHAYTTRNVRAKLAGDGASIEPFVLAGEDWFVVDDKRAMSWPKILETVDAQQKGLADAIENLPTAEIASDVKPFDLVLGITCHAIYHAGQVQLIKVLKAR
jgi:hypothetical protein